MKGLFNHSAPLALATVLVVGPIGGAACAAGPADAAGGGSRSGLVYHEVTDDGSVVKSRRAGRAFNPASVMKVATTVMVLERLGRHHRFLTLFGYRGELDLATGVLRGELVVAGAPWNRIVSFSIQV